MRLETWQDGVLVEVLEQPSAPVVPTAVTSRQAKSALLLAGWLGSTREAVQSNGLAMFDALPEPQRSLGGLAWLESTEFQRSNPWVIAMGQAMGKTSADIDQLFIAAAGI